MSEGIEKKSSAWVALSNELPNIEELLVPASEADSQWLIQAFSNGKADIGLSVTFMRRLGPELLAVFPLGCMNLHPSLLPYNRGTWPELWSIIEGSPAGVTLHYMDRTLDTGDIVAQLEVMVESYDTGESLCAKIDAAGLSLITRYWPQVSTCRAQASAQSVKTRLRKDAERLQMEKLDLSQVGTLKQHLDLLRALTLRPFISGGWYSDAITGRRVNVVVEFTVSDATHEPYSGGNA